MSADLCNEVLKSVAEDYYELAGQVAKLDQGPGSVAWGARVASMDTLETVGDRIAKALGVAAPLWESMREMAGLEW